MSAIYNIVNGTIDDPLRRTV